MTSPDLDSTPANARPLRISYDPQLPISARIDDIAELMANNKVVIVAGETGSGKTTQLPKVALQLGRKAICHTQPRRIAARSVAERIADELDVPLGEEVGYQVRFTRETSKQTRLKVVTDGVLLAEINRDRDLRRYDTIIVDEAHERSLNIDFLLGYLKQLLTRRDDLLVVITSATIDTERFSEHFDGAPIIEVSGRGYPVEVRYQPLDEDSDEPIDQADGIVKACRGLIHEGRGDILVFCSGEREIRDAADALENAHLGGREGVEILPLFARLSVAEQNRVFAPHNRRRIVLATNVAETSLTVPGIVYVVDPGTARISRYSARTKVQRLPIEPISQASANQRAGRCGRVAPGICVRLYSEEDFLARPAFTEPEILRTNLASVILKMAQARLGDIANFPFVEAPDKAQINDGVRLLNELGALKPGKGPARLTQTGHQLANLPIDPRLGRMLVEAERRNCLREVMIIVAALAIQDVRERPTDHRDEADALHARFGQEEIVDADQVTAPGLQPTIEQQPLRHTAHTSKTLRAQMAGGGAANPKQAAPAPGGDILALLRLWRYLERKRAELSSNQFRKLCRNEYLNYLRVREWQDLQTQLRDICRGLGMHRNAKPASPDAVLTSVLTGLLSNVGLLINDEQKPTTKTKPGRRPRRTQREYLGARGTKFAINPGSLLAKHPPELVMAVEVVETSRLWARQVAQIEPEWVEQVGGHLLKRSYSEPHWSTDAGAVVAYERVSLYGIPLVADRLVGYAKIDAAIARRIFIQAGLVEGGWRPRSGRVNHDFLAHNDDVRAEAEEIADRTRRNGMVVDDRVIADFYEDHLPSSVVSGETFDAWWRTVSDRTVLELAITDVLPDADDATTQQFPDTWRVGDSMLPVSYVFEPGGGRDGVTVSVPLGQLSGLNPAPFSWQVPGLRQELATELIRALPKSVRTSLVPAPDKAKQALLWLRDNDADQDRPFCLELGRALAATTGVMVGPDQWNPAQVPEHLQVGFDVHQANKPHRFSRDLSSLQDELSTQVSSVLTRASKQSSEPSASWTFGTIPATQKVKGSAMTAIGYPALADRGTGAVLIMAETPAVQASTHRLGVRRLLMLVNPDPTKWTVAHLTNTEKLALPNGPYATVPQLLADARLTAVGQAGAAHCDLASVRDEKSFDDVALAVRQIQADQMRHVTSLAAEVNLMADRVRRAAVGAPGNLADEVLAEMGDLVFDGYLSFTRAPWLGQLPKYLKAKEARLVAARTNPKRDAQLMAPVYELREEYDDFVGTLPPGRLPDVVDDVVFLIEELQIQIFAQQLGTVVTVSPKRIRKQLATARAELGR